MTRYGLDTACARANDPDSESTAARFRTLTKPDQTRPIQSKPEVKSVSPSGSISTLDVLTEPVSAFSFQHLAFRVTPQTSKKINVHGWCNGSQTPRWIIFSLAVLAAVCSPPSP